MSAVFVDSKMDDRERRGRLYSGDIFLYSPTTSTRSLINLAKSMIEEAFAPHDPRTIHEHLSAEQVAVVLSKLKPAFIHHRKCKELIPQIMKEHGVDREKLYFDVPRLRSAYPSHFLSSGIAYAFHPHRDTWYSAPMCQLNWWLPIYAIEPENAMGFYNDYFDTPVRNSSEIYNYYEWNEKHRATAAQHITKDTREQPKLQQELNSRSICYLPPPGGIILFSGAQLHETMPNTTNAARYSIDFRTVHLDDVETQRGAVNLDSRCTGTTMRDYICAANGQSLPEELVSMYDDGTATAGKILRFGDRLATT